MAERSLRTRLKDASGRSLSEALAWGARWESLRCQWFSTYRHVFLHPDVDGYNANPAPIHNRLAYVGITRAAETLHVVADQEVG